MEEQGLPGLQARYEIVPSGEGVELRLGLRFDPAEAGPAEPARGVWLELWGRLAGGTGTRLPPATAGLVTSLAAAPLTVTADGVELRERLADFVAEVAAGPAPAAAAIAVDLAFSLARQSIADLPNDIFELGVRLDVGAAPVVIALPRLEGGLRAFATAFEQAWQGFDGADGHLVLAAESSGDSALWCVRTGTAHGLAIAPAAAAEIVAYAVPPLSTGPLSGTIEGADGGAVRVEAIDLDHWWDLFAAELGRLAADPGDLQGRFERARGDLARGMAGRLVPVAGQPHAGGIKEARAVFEAAATADLRSRPVVVGIAVEVSRGARLLGEPASVLHGKASTPSGTAGAAAGSPGAVRLKAGRQWLAYAAPEPFDDRTHQAFSIRFDGNRIERGDAPTLGLILQSNAPGVDLGPQSAPVPRIGVPGLPAFPVAEAMASPEAEAPAAALAWTVEIETPAIPAARDRLELAIDLEGGAAPTRSPGPAPEGALFEALGRAVRFGGTLPAEPDTEALARFATLAEAVAEALPGWQAPVREPPPLPGDWVYSIDFAEWPILVVGRAAQGSGRRPLWPSVAGYVTPTSEDATARYQPEAGGAAGAGLRISVPGLRLLGNRSVRVHGRISRNIGLDPAFVYHGGIASSAPCSPSLEWQAPQPEPRAESLEAALGALLAAIDEDSQRPYALGVQAELVRPLDSGGEAALETRIPLAAIRRVAIGGEDCVSPAELKAQLAKALAAARAQLDPDYREEEIALAVTLLDEESADSPLARLNVRIRAPGNAAWWSPAWSRSSY